MNRRLSVSFELLYRGIITTNLYTFQNITIKSKFFDTVFSSFDIFKTNKPKSDLSDINALNSLLQNEDIIIHKADKANIIVIVIDNDAYKKKMNAIISDCSQFEKLDIQEEKHINFILHKEKRLMQIIKPLYEKGCFTKIEYLKICPSGSKQDIPYKQAKVHEPVKDDCPSFCLFCQQLAHEYMI